MLSTQTDAIVAAKAITLIDNTSLNNSDTEEQITLLAKSSIECPPHTACLCVYRKFVPVLKKLQENGKLDSAIKIATVVNFPEGKDSIDLVLEDTRSAIADGANEIDLVINYKLLKEDRCAGTEDAGKLISAVRNVCTGNEVSLKVIIESGELGSNELITVASKIALENGADFVKTSTGKVSVNATLDAARTILEVCKSHKAAHPEATCGFKAAGGIRTYKDALEYMQLAEQIMGYEYLDPKTFRFGASSLLKELRNIASSC